jgi:hypothetical protein
MLRSYSMGVRSLQIRLSFSHCYSLRQKFSNQTHQLLNVETKLIPAEIKQLESVIDEIVKKRITPVTVQSFVEHAHRLVSEPIKTREQIGRFVMQELPIRIAHIYKILQDLSDPLKNMRCVQQLRMWYLQTVQDILLFREKSVGVTGDVYSDGVQVVCNQILNRHQGTVVMMASEYIRGGAFENATKETRVEYQRFLNRLYLSRIGTRMLQNQFIEVRNSAEGFQGVFEENLNVKLLCEVVELICMHVHLHRVKFVYAAET